MFAIDKGENKRETGAQAGRTSSAQTLMLRTGCCSELLCGQIYRSTTSVLVSGLKHALLQEHM